MMDFTPALDSLELLSEHACFGGVQRFYRHQSSAVGLPMRFALFLPPQAVGAQAVPLVMYLAGLTCTEETFVTKGGAQRGAAALGLALLAPDTSPRGADIAGEADAWDFGLAAGFYLDASQAPWSRHYRMESYLLRELLPSVLAQPVVRADQVGIMGHSMGGHGALTLALRHPGRFQSVSAFAPICAPSQCPWGEKAFTGYLGQERSAWLAHDASALMAQRQTPLLPYSILVDQGLADKFLPSQLHPQALEAACAQAGQALTLRRHAGYDHGYYFISTFMEDHLRHHAQCLAQVGGA